MSLFLNASVCVYVFVHKVCVRINHACGFTFMHMCMYLPVFRSVFISMLLNVCVPLSVCEWACVCNVYLLLSAEVCISASACFHMYLPEREDTSTIFRIQAHLCAYCNGACVCMHVYVSVRARPAAACVTLVNIKAALCFAELTNLSHPSPRAAFETHTAGLGSGLWTLNHSLPRPPCSSPYQIIL